jgi:hypothetical protein
MRLIAAVGLPAVVIAGGAVWLLVRAERPGRRAVRARGLRRLAEVCGVVVLVTAAFLRPWYWDVAVVVLALAGAAGVRAMTDRLEHRPTPASGRAIVTAMATVVVGSVLVTLAGTAAVLDGASVAGGRPVPVPHDGRVLAQPVLYQLFWGRSWAQTPPPPALAAAVAFQHTLATTAWTAAVVRGGFGVRSISSGGCWIDPTDPPAGATITTTATGPFPSELRRVLDRRRHVVPCPGLPAEGLPGTLPLDALVVVWLGPHQGYGLGGVSAHGALTWSHRPNGLAVAAITGGFASWGERACADDTACRGLPAGVTPAYALSHEVVEAATNPYGDGWYADPPVQWSARYFLAHGPTSLLGSAPQFQGEVADLCEPGQPDAAPQPTTSAVRQFGLAPFYRPGVGCPTR